jgi:hypothetical protein
MGVFWFYIVFYVAHAAFEVWESTSTNLKNERFTRLDAKERERRRDKTPGVKSITCAIYPSASAASPQTLQVLVAPPSESRAGS